MRFLVDTINGSDKLRIIQPADEILKGGYVNGGKQTR